MSKQVLLDAKVVHDTDYAVLIELPDGEEKWVPRSVLQDGGSLEFGDTDLICAEWFAKKEGLM